MRTLVGNLSIAAILVTCGCAKDPHSIRITDKNKDTLLEEAKDMKGLTVQEVQLLLGYELRSKMSNVFGAANHGEFVGKTVGELLEALKKQARDEKLETDKQSRLAQEAKAKEDAIATELRKSIDLTVFAKDYVPSDFQAGRLKDFITLKVAYQNTSAKDIRAFKGTVQYTDLFGSEIYSSRLTISDPVKAGQKGQWSGVIEYNQFIHAQQQLRNTDLKDMKVIWKPASVIFADGTQIGGQ
jgi:hypothetical protein